MIFLALTFQIKILLVHTASFHCITFVVQFRLRFLFSGEHNSHVLLNTFCIQMFLPTHVGSDKVFWQMLYGNVDIDMVSALCGLFSHVKPVYPLKSMLPGNAYICMASLLCEFSHVPILAVCARTFSDKMNNYMASDDSRSRDVAI